MVYSLRKKDDEADVKIAMMVDYFTWNWHNRWSLLRRLIKEGELDVVLSPRAMSWLSELEYEHIEALEEETEWGADKARNMETWLVEEFTRSLWLGDVALRIRKASAMVTNCWLKDQFQDSLQRDEAA